MGHSKEREGELEFLGDPGERGPLRVRVAINPPFRCRRVRDTRHAHGDEECWYHMRITRGTGGGPVAAAEDEALGSGHPELLRRN